ncbi:hypothetical protein [Halorussus amylolyticus]|nr:hypothetical protein [Halorussus amylolyticus]
MGSNDGVRPRVGRRRTPDGLAVRTDSAETQTDADRGALACRT